MSSRSGSRVSPYERAEQALLSQAVENSRADAPSSATLKEQQQPHFPPTATAPFQSLHGTLDNTTPGRSNTSPNTSTSLGISSSSDQILPSSVLPQLPQAAVNSSISDPNTSNSASKRLQGSIAQTDEIRNSFSTSDRSTKPKMSSEIETSMNSGLGLGTMEKPEAIDERDVVPDSDDEGSGSGELSLPSPSAIRLAPDATDTGEPVRLL